MSTPTQALSQAHEPARAALGRMQANGLLLLVAMVWALAFVAQSRAMVHIEPMHFTGLRFWIGALVVAPLAWWEYKRNQRLQRPTPSTGDGLRIAGLGALLALGASLQQIGMVSSTVTNAGFLTALYVPLVPVLAWLLMGQRPHALVWVACAGCVLGTWLLSGVGATQFQVGDAWIIAAVLPWALHVLWVGDVARRMQAPFAVACGQFVACGTLSLLVSVALEGGSWAFSRQAWTLLLFTGVLSVGVAYTLQVVAQGYTRATDAAILLSSETLFSAVCGYVFMADQLSPMAWLGCALIFTCMMAVQLVGTPDAAAPEGLARQGAA